MKSLVASWLNKQEEHVRQTLSDCIRDYFYKALEWVLKNVIHLEVRSMMCTLEILLFFVVPTYFFLIIQIRFNINDFLLLKHPFCELNSIIFEDNIYIFIF